MNWWQRTWAKAGTALPTLAVLCGALIWLITVFVDSKIGSRVAVNEKAISQVTEQVDRLAKLADENAKQIRALADGQKQNRNLLGQMQKTSQDIRRLISEIDIETTKRAVATEANRSVTHLYSTRVGNYNLNILTGLPHGSTSISKQAVGTMKANPSAYANALDRAISEVDSAAKYIDSNKNRVERFVATSGVLGPDQAALRQRARDAKKELEELADDLRKRLVWLRQYRSQLP